MPSAINIGGDRMERAVSRSWIAVASYRSVFSLLSRCSAAVISLFGLLILIKKAQYFQWYPMDHPDKFVAETATGRLR